MFKLSRATGMFAGLLLAGAIHAQPAPDYAAPDSTGADQSNAAEAVDPPSRVARLSMMQGAVSFVPAGENDWVEAQLNRPLVTGDKLWTDSGARAELQIGPAAIRVDQQTSFNVLNLDDQTAQVELSQGALNLRVRRLYDGQTYEVDTPTLAFVINRVGEYRVDVAPDGNGAIVTVFHGSGDAYGEAGARFRVEEGQSTRFNDPQLHDYVSNNVPSPDDFDRFSFDRDGRWDGSPSRQFVSEDIIGYEDLDNNGSWSDEPDIGNVWYPSNVADDWTPYSYGSWGWVGAYGWTWVDAAPWGFAPFHYGRWAYVHNRWGWCPGSAHERPYYAPALVAFIGGGGVGVGFVAGRPVGWFPLGPRDVYVPGYRVSRDYFARVNLRNSAINSATIGGFYGSYARGNFDYNRVNYANRNIVGAVTAVPGNVFVGARPIRGSALAVSRDTFANARVSGFAAIAPTPQSLAFTGGAHAVGAPPRAVLSRNVIAATRPPAAPVPFAQREVLLQRDPGRTLSTSQLHSVEGGAANNGTQPQRAATFGRPNVNVVTNNGQPAHLPAQAIVPHTPIQGPIQQQTAHTLPGFPSSERETRMREQQPNNTVESRAIETQPNRYVQPTDSASKVQSTNQLQNTEVNRGPREITNNAAQQQFRSAPVEHTAQPEYRRPPANNAQESTSVPSTPQADGQQQSYTRGQSERDFHRVQQPQYQTPQQGTHPIQPQVQPHMQTQVQQQVQSHDEKLSDDKSHEGGKSHDGGKSRDDKDKDDHSHR